jgi:predicted alpha/beta hydrolase
MVGAAWSGRAADGVALGGTLWRPDAPRAAVLITGATATPARYYARFAGWLADRGYAVLTFDYRGIGASRRGSLRGDPATMSAWGALDVEAALAALRAEVPGVPVLAIGHSFGGQALGLSPGLAGVDGLLTVGAQLGYYGHWPRAARARMWVVWHVLFPAFLATWGYIPGWSGIGEDLPPGVAREWSRWCRSPGYLTDHVGDAADRMRGFAGAAEVWAVTDDDYAPEGAVRAYAALVGPEGAPVRVVAPTERPIGHFGFFRPTFAETLWRDAEGILARWSDGAARRARG